MNPVSPRPSRALGVLLIVGILAAAGPATAQVELVEDINEGEGGTWVFRAGALGYAIYFSAYDGVHGEELWVSDGTALGTYLVEDIWPETTPDGTGAFSSKPESFIATTSEMYFGASHREDPDNLPNHDYNLWRSTGTVGSAAQISGFEFGYGATSMANAVVFGNQLLIAGWDETYGIELWKVSGTTATRLTDIEPGVGGSDPGYLTAVGSQLFFSATNTDTSGIELWVTDGTSSGETLVDIVDGTGSSYPSYITAFDGEAYFSAYTEAGGAELWASDGTEGGTRMVADINPTAGEGGEPMNLVAVGDQLFFTADDGSGRELWVTDGSTTQKIEGGYNSISESVAFNGRLFYVNNHSDSGVELWASDGTGAGTGLFVDIYPGTYPIGENDFGYSSNPTELTVAGDFLFFNADDGTHGPSLWVTDGTEAGTFMVANLFDYWSEEGPKGLTAATNRLFFQTETEELGREVYALLTANVVKPPAAPTGEQTGATETAYTYETTGGSVSLDGEPVEYRFHWGDGESTEWLDVGVTSAEHTWAEGGTYEVTVEARSSVMTTITSNHSAALSVLMSFTESVEASITAGPDTGEIWIDYDFTVSGSSDYGHDLELQVDWGDGSDPTAWASFDPAAGATVTHDWDELGDWPVTVTLRCAEHTDVTDSAQHWITIEEETIGTPTIDGPTTGWTDTEYSFTIGGESSAGHDLEHIVHWGDGGDTGWQPFGEGQTSAEVSHTWTVAEPFTVEVGVRCATHDSLEGWNSDHSIEITAPPEEEITGPTVVRPDSGYPDISYAVTISASSNLGHDLEYQLDWGDGTAGISWTAFGEGVTSVQLSHAWEAASTYPMYFEVRCIEDPDKYADAGVDMFIDPEVIADKSLSGPSSGVAGASYDFSLTAHSASEHALEYQVYWGHGPAPTWQDLNPATSVADLSHTWPVDGQDHNYQVDYGVRCKGHTGVEEWDSISVSIPGETITDHTLEGPNEGLVGVDSDFTVTGISPDEHALEYKFEWGDDFPTAFAALTGGTAAVSYHWALPGEYTVRSSVRCATHNHVLSEKTMVVTVTSGTPSGWLFGDGFESGDVSGWSSSAGTSP